VLFDELLIVWRPEHESMESRHYNYKRIFLEVSINPTT